MNTLLLTIRVCVPGCSSREVLSLAMLPTEELGERRNRTANQSFGTDISDQAIEQAHAGIYPESSLADVSHAPETLF